MEKFLQSLEKQLHQSSLEEEEPHQSPPEAEEIDATEETSEPHQSSQDTDAGGIDATENARVVRKKHRLMKVDAILVIGLIFIAPG